MVLEPKLKESLPKKGNASADVKPSVDVKPTSKRTSGEKIMFHWLNQSSLCKCVRRPLLRKATNGNHL